MVLGFLLYEAVDLLYNVTKITWSAGSYVFRWYTGDDQRELEIVELDISGNVINIHDIYSNITKEQLEQTQKIKLLEDKIKELEEQVLALKMQREALTIAVNRNADKDEEFRLMRHGLTKLPHGAPCGNAMVSSRSSWNNVRLEPRIFMDTQ